MWEFWIKNIIEGLKCSFELFGVIDLVCVIITTILYWKREQHRQIWEKLEPSLKKYALLILGLQLFVGVFWWQPYVQFKTERKDKEIAQLELNDRKPKLDGFFHRTFIADEPATTNSLIFIDIGVANSGRAPSLAEEYRLKIKSETTNFLEAETINFLSQYTYNFIFKDKPWLLDLKRTQLLSEKTTRAILTGESPRGWLAFRVKGKKPNIIHQTNLVLSFLDIEGTKTSVTNGYWKGQKTIFGDLEDLTTPIPGAENIFYPVVPIIQTNWLPPELDPNSHEVIIVFGTNIYAYPIVMAKINPDSGTKIEIKDLPDHLFKNIESSPNYSPRQKEMWFKYDTIYTEGDKSFSFPVSPLVVSNRLYVKVEIPFLNEKRTLVMSDKFDDELKIPPSWDRNYSTNYDGFRGIFAYEIVNELKNPVLQVAYAAPNVVVVNGIFQVGSNTILAAFGERPMLLDFILSQLSETNRNKSPSLAVENFHEALVVHSNESSSSFGLWLTNEFFRPVFKYQRPMFKYPSNRNLGVFAEYPDTTNKVDSTK